MSTITQPHVRRVGGRLAAPLVVAVFGLAACGGGDDVDSSDGLADDPAADADSPDGVTDDGDSSDGDLSDGVSDDLDTSGLDEGQLEILDEAVEGLNETDDEDAPPAWSGIRLVSGFSDVRVEQLDADAFAGAVEGFTTSTGDSVSGLERSGRLVDSDVVVGDSIWVAGSAALTRVSLVDGAITATISIDDVLPGGEFSDITGDADGLYAVAFVAGGGDVLAEVDPVAGTLRGTIDLTDDTTSLLTVASNESHVAAAYRDAPGIPVKLIERATGSITDVGNFTAFHEVHFVRDELWVVSSSGSVSEPGTYDKFGLDGSLIGSGTLPGIGQVNVFGDRIVLLAFENDVDPSNPVAPIEVEPQGPPIESLLPADLVSLSGFAEIDGFAVSAGGCCLTDDGGFPLNVAVIDIATGEVVHTADSLQATEILPAGD